MSKEQLTKLVEDLRSEISQLPPEDEQARQRIGGIIAELDRSIEDETPDTMRGSIQDAVHELEARHPDATTVLNNILMTLANMGI